jgi:uncharacterized protein (TIGR03086 family)
MNDVQLEVLSRGLDQAAGMLADVPEERLGEPTPCPDWTVADLVDHLVLGPAKFAQSVRGEQVDWSAPTPHVGADRADLFRAAADELLAAWREQGTDGAPIGPDWQSAEVAVHTYDLATALGRGTGDLDPQPAERGLAFMQANLKPEMRGDAFGAEQPAPEGADAYERIAAFAGRTVTPSR